MNAITKIDQQQTKSATPWQELPINERLSAVLDERNSLSQMPVVGPKSAAQLRQFLAHPGPPCPRRDQVETMLAKLSVALPKSQMSDAEAHERLDLYWQALKGHALIDLQQVFGELLRKCRFFPTIAEIEEIIAPIRGKRMARFSQARLLLLKHDHEWRAPIAPEDMADPAEVKALLVNMAGDA